MKKHHRLIRSHPIIGSRIMLIALFILCLMPSQVLAARVGVVMSLDSTQSFGVWGSDFGPNSQVTLEVDNGNDGFVEYWVMKSADSSGGVDFEPEGNWSVQPGDLVRMYDDQPLPNIKEYIVDYLTLESVDYASDTLAGKTDPGNPVHVRVMGPSGGPALNTVSDGSGNWSVDFSGTFDIIVGSTALVQTNDFDGDYTISYWPVNLPGFSVEIDIKPKSDRKPIDVKSKGVVPVAILGDETFDVTKIDVGTLAFGPTFAIPVHDLTDLSVYEGHLQDVNLDGEMDLVTHFYVQRLGIECGDSWARLVGKTELGENFEGIDSIITVGCKKRK